ncbi:MAG: HAD family phosphatase [Clostridia bacterium]|nr:HAD family phosphatase [Clostridia bacterium]
MYKLVVVDLDGTLLNSYGVVTENTKKIIKETINNGTDVVIASGRSVMDYMKNISKEIGSQNYFIAGNGAIVYDIKNDKTIYKKYLNKNKVLEIIKECEKNSIYYNIYTKNAIITKSLNYNTLYYHKENLKKEEDKRTVINIVENPYKYVENSDEDFLKIAICDNDEIIFNSIIKKIKKIKNIEILETEHMASKKIKQGTQEISVEYFYTEITRAGVDKWETILFLTETMGIKPEEVIAIGDNINDYKMIQNAGIGVAMGESMPKVKEIADYVTEDNNNEGVANALQKYITNILQKY